MSISEIRSRYQVYREHLQQKRAQLQAATKLRSEAEQSLLVHQQAADMLNFIHQQVSLETENRIASLVTEGLQDVFYDLNLSLHLEPVVYRGLCGLRLKLQQGEGDEVISGDPSESFGGGPQALTGLLLQVVCVLQQPEMRRILILDEPLVQISPEYQERAAYFLRKLCEPEPQGLGFSMLVVTHSPAITAAAHRVYSGDDINNLTCTLGD